MTRNGWVKWAALADENKQLISASLYSVQVVRVLARLLAIDARVAATRGEGTSAAADLMALVGLSEQLFVPDGTLVEQLVGISIFGQAMDTLGHVLADSPAGALRRSVAGAGASAGGVSKR